MQKYKVEVDHQQSPPWFLKPASDEQDDNKGD